MFPLQILHYVLLLIIFAKWSNILTSTTAYIVQQFAMATNSLHIQFASDNFLLPILPKVFIVKVNLLYIGATQ